MLKFRVIFYSQQFFIILRSEILEIEVNHSPDEILAFFMFEGFFPENRPIELLLFFPVEDSVENLK